MAGAAREPVVALDEPRLVGADRVLAVLKELAQHPNGISLDELTRIMGSPKPTVHRALGALRRAGMADQDPRGRYVLGDELLRMAFAHHEARPEHVRVQPVLEQLALTFGETAHYAVLDGRDVVYRAKVDPPSGGVRLTSVVGGRNPAHATAVGKLLLAYELRSVADVRRWTGGTKLERKTANTRTTPSALHDDLSRARELGFALDDQENELGVNCLAVPVFTGSASVPSGAISVSAVTYRTPLDELLGRVDDIRHALGSLRGPH